MYESRLHATNGLISIAIDARSAELLELVSERTADNLIKSNCHPRAWSPFLLEAPGEDGSRRLLHPARYEQIFEDPTLAPVIRVEQREKDASIHVDYPAVVEDGKRCSVQVSVDVELPEGKPSAEWRISVNNGLSDEIQKVIFPCINGVYLGDTWEDDELAFPYHSGILVKNPVHRLSEPPRSVYWKWQEYQYCYRLNGPTGVKDDRDSYVLECSYSGPASMLWMDLFDRGENCGLYLTCRNEQKLLKALRVETFGECFPGMGLSIVHYPCMKPGASWQSETSVLALHPGDWHWGADEYRAWRESLHDRTPRRHRPEWFEKSPGLVAHYDFKYQGGGIVHRFKDIPALLEQARAMGLNHLLISGWNFDGFDHGFPQYWPDPALGTEEDLREAVHTVRRMGGHLAFYINSRLCNTKYPDRAELIRSSAIMHRDGSLQIERYGAGDLEFACLCNQSTAWRDEFVGVVNYLTHDIGADSMYLDQLAMGSGQLCYHPGHTEHADNPAMWNLGYRKMLAQMREGYDQEGMALLYEGVSDLYGWGASGQLISTMFFQSCGAYPEMYKYTFPDQILVDMMNPRRNSGMRAEHVARMSTFLLFRAFVVGSYLWVYDLEMDNTFRRDPEQYERLRRVTALRSAWLEAYGQGVFRDTVGLGAVSEGLLAKRYELESGSLIVCANEKHVKGASVEAFWEGSERPRVWMRTDREPGREQPVDCAAEAREGGYAVSLPLCADDELCLFRLG